MSTTLIRGGRVITADREADADVLLADGLIAAVGEGLEVSADRVVDAEGRYVIPGCVDPHTHLDLPFGGTRSCDDFTTGTLAAACGGTTCLIDFAYQARGEDVRESYSGWVQRVVDHPPVVDVSFHLAVTDFEAAGGLAAFRALVEQGVTTFKAFMAYEDVLMVDDRALFRLARIAGELGAMLMVHAENGQVIGDLVEEARLAGNLEPVWHARTRPAEVEAEATNRAAHIAHLAGCRLYVVHVTCAGAAAAIAQARENGWDVWGETCTQYLALDDSRLAQPGFEGAKYVFSPPLRTPADQEALWRAISAGDLSVISTDHAPFRYADQKTLGAEDFSKIPNGIPGVEERLAVVHELGVRGGRISLQEMVRLLATAPARLFGLYPRKGTIAPGADADVVIFDPDRRGQLSAADLHSGCDYTPYEGLEVRGAVETVLVGGRVLVESGEAVDDPAPGRLLQREPSVPA